MHSPAPSRGRLPTPNPHTGRRALSETQKTGKNEQECFEAGTGPARSRRREGASGKLTPPKLAGKYEAKRRFSVFSAADVRPGAGDSIPRTGRPRWPPR